MSGAAPASVMIAALATAFSRKLSVLRLVSFLQAVRGWKRSDVKAVSLNKPRLCRLTKLDRTCTPAQPDAGTNAYFRLATSQTVLLQKCYVTAHAACLQLQETHGAGLH
jgi:hypothetical protein